MDGRRRFRESRVAIGMLVVQGFNVGLQILSRIIVTQGTFIFALITYRQIIATVFVAPLALYYERGHFKKLTWLACLWLFMVALTGTPMAMGFYYYGLRDTTATYATNFLNLIPVVTFILSTVIRIEKVGVHTRVGKIKIIGAIICLVGALTVALYKGPTVISHQNSHPLIKKTNPKYLRGTVFLLASILSYALWFIFQMKLLKVFPYKYMGTMLICMIASVQPFIIGLFIDHSHSSWSLQFDMHLFTIVYSGAFATAATFCLISWAVTQKGPTYPSMFNPLSLIIVTIVEALFMSENLKLGSLIGMLLIVIGLYAFLWAKNKEFKTMKLALSLAEAEAEATHINHELTEIAGGSINATHSVSATVAPLNSPSEHAANEIINVQPSEITTAAT